MNPSEQIQEMERRLLKAMLASDASALDSLISDQAVVVGPDGRLSNKMDDVAAHRDGLLRILTMEPQEVTTQLLSEGVAIVFALMKMQGTYQDHAFGGRYRYTRVWHKQGKGWQIFAAHISPMPS
jgi:ketosteroid isomerase-like protein